MNRLAGETSPYLLQHADNPVDWYPWGDEALARARAEDKPILLSIGYAACHWCHVMEHESFEDAAIAALMNEHFVSVKVDREERPDLDAIYMEAVVALTGQGGWPMTVFLTPDGEPFYGGTYFPPEPRHGLPSFQQVLEAIAEAWRERRDDVARSAAQLVEAVGQLGVAPARRIEPLTDALLAGAVRVHAGAAFEPAFGGWGRAPKFPNAPVLEFLLRRGDDDDARDGRRRRSTRWRPAGMYDLLGGGFHRYSVDDRWLVPHFEKMLYDNALLAPAYLHGWLVTGEERYREIAERDDRVPAPRAAAAGGRLRLGPGRRHGRRRGADVHVDGGGRRSGRRCWSRSSTGARSSAASSTERLRARLLELREQRPKPLRDDKAIASWNGLALAALAEAGRRLERPDWIDAARIARRVPARPALRRGRPAAAQLPRRAHERSRLPRRLRERRARPARAPRRDRRAALARGGEPAGAARGRALRRRGARRLLPLTRQTASALVARTKELDDHPLPSGNSMLAHVLLRLARIYGDDELERRASSVLRLVRPALERAPTAFGWALCALDLHLSPPRELAIVGPVDSEVARAALRAVAAEHGRRGRAADDEVPLLAGKTLVDGKPAVYVCERFACRRPVTDPALL